MEPLVSVVMTVYNYERYVAESIESILAQTFRDFEFIIIDDASSDSTQKVISGFIDRRIVFVRNDENLGQTRSLNKALRLARGTYIARIDGDDVSFPDRLKRQVDFLERNPRVGVVGTWLQSVDERNRLIRKSRYPVIPTLGRLLFLNLFNWPCLTHPTVMVRKGCFETVGPYNEQYRISQDYDLWLRVARKFRMRNIPHILLNYREHRQSLSHSRKNKTRQEVRQIVVSNVRHFLPGIDSRAQERLVNLLMFDPQPDSSSAQEVFEVLDKFLASVQAHVGSELAYPGELAYLKKMARVLYLPRLFGTNPRTALGELLRATRTGNRWLFSSRFAKAIGHAILR